MPSSRSCLWILLVASGGLLGNIVVSGGELWPLPQVQTSTNRTLCLHEEAFQIKAVGEPSAVLNRACDRYTSIVLDTPAYQPLSASLVDRLLRADGTIRELHVTVRSDYVSLGLETDERYKLLVREPVALLEAETVYGALRGLETFVQLVDRIDLPDEGEWAQAYDGATGNKHRPRSVFVMNVTDVVDWPRYPHRGLLIDSARHFLPVPVIKTHLDAMAMSKMNVLHWHLVDDQAFPYQSSAWPLLSLLGAYSPKHVYSPDDVADVVLYARDRGIRVVPEFDTPGHTLSWGKGYPDLLADCYGSDGLPTGAKGPIDPTRNSTYDFLRQLLHELARVFPDQYIHLGGDEVSMNCWQSNPNITAWMTAHNIGDTAKLEQYFERQVLDIARDVNRSAVVWQEVLDNGVEMENDTVVHIWKWWLDKYPPGVPPAVQILKPYFIEMDWITRQGYRVLLSAPWYLNLGSYVGDDWAEYYKIDPAAWPGTPEQQALVMGGEACMWGEVVDSTNAVAKTWPRACSVSERLWSNAAVSDPNAALPRLEQHRCRLLARGIPAQPLDPGFCPAASWPAKAGPETVQTHLAKPTVALWPSRWRCWRLSA